MVRSTDGTGENGGACASLNARDVNAPTERSGSKISALASEKNGAQLKRTAAMENIGTTLSASACARRGVPREPRATAKEANAGTIASACALSLKHSVVPQA